MNLQALRPKSLFAQAGVRLFLAFAISAILTLAAAAWVYREANWRADEYRKFHALEHYKAALTSLEQDWGREAYNFRLRLEFSRVLEDSATRQERMQGFLTAQGGSAVFPGVRVVGVAGETLSQFYYRSTALPAATFAIGDDEAWAYDHERRQLFRVYRQVLWLGKENGQLLLYKPMDNALLTGMAYPETRLDLVWKGGKVASSRGTDGLTDQGAAGGTDAARFVVEIPWNAQRSDSPLLRIGFLRSEVFSPGEFSVPLAASLLAFAIVVWAILGYWLLTLLRRIRAIEQAEVAFLAGRRISDEVDLLLNHGRRRRRDEITALADSLHRLMQETVSYEAAQGEAMRMLLESADRHRGILATSADGFLQINSSGWVLDVNPSYLALSGYTREELLIRDMKALEAEDAPERCATLCKRLATEGHLRFETRHRRRDGSTWDVEVSASRGTGSEDEYFLFLRDITRRKQVEIDLRVAAVTFQAQEGITVTDAERRILRVNDAFTRITGYPAREVVGQTPKLLASGRHDDAFYRDMWSTIDREGAWAGEIWNRRKTGEIYPEWLSISSVRGGDGRVTHYVGTFADITHRKEAEEQIRYLAYYDPLTKLPNRRLLMDRLQQALAASARRQRHGALFLLDIDDFKTLNDTQGHDVGDQFLRQVAERIAAAVREGDTVARLGGDEFVVLLQDLDAETVAAVQAERIAAKLQASLRQPYQLDLAPGGGVRAVHSHYCTASIGIALFLGKDVGEDELLKRADTAMYEAKSLGRNTLTFFDPDMQAAIAARAALHADLRMAVRRNQFILHYQPQVDHDGRVRGAEALVRWHHPQRGMISPAEFIPLAEATGLILPIGHWVLETACKQLATWARYPELAELTIAVNVSARQFKHRDFVDLVTAVIEATGANPNRLKLELTESMLAADVDDIVVKMAALKETGVGFSLDDFGTGYSSLYYLKSLPLDQLKIDQSFVRDVLTDANDAAIAGAIVALAHSLGLSVIAEGVEVAAQRDFLARSGCRRYQGYFFSRPLPAESFEAYARGASPCTLQ